MSEEQITRGIVVECHSVTGAISKAFGKAMLQGYLLELGRYCYDKEVYLWPVYLR